jgi:hypothetical protein
MYESDFMRVFIEFIRAFAAKKTTYASISKIKTPIEALSAEIF